MSNVATRLLSMILLMQSRPTWKASDLADELGVSERTVHRYIGMLEELGIPLYSERGPYGGFALVRGYKLPPLIFTAEEATVLYMGANLVGEVWGQTYKDAVTAVTAKLDNVLPDDLRHEVASARQSLVISGLAARDYRPWEPIIHTLRECIMHRCGVRLIYQSFALEETSRDIEPYALTFHGGLWYLVGFCRLRQAMRTFRVDRIQRVTPLKIPFTIPRDFSARDYITQTLSFEQNYTVVVDIAANVAPHIRERYSHWMELTEHDDGSVTARFGASTLEWATGWALSYGEAVKVLEPPELIARVRAAAEAILQQYMGV
ncbi:MAG TPA: YafY family protein [Anaerolineae bacterium]|nr:YafY family protein [Anaerolineae bacterium]HQI86578.1 YafY family protein [Anaerolineae bacterium]